ncbi:MAG: arsenate reductase ArsC [Chloroflexi bacterium]|nr:arsenate reductase ArsC [Chloroflexota bacterium]
MERTLRVLVLCTHNSARSQMAEALLRHESGGRIDVLSAGMEPTGVHALAVEAMREARIDISAQQPTLLDAVVNEHFDYVITVCDRAAEACPVFPEETKRMHWSFEDPAAVEGSEEERLAAFRRVRVGLLRRIRLFLQLPAVESAVSRAS